MAVWDTIANIQNIFKKKPDVTDTPTHNQNGWVKFGVALDIAKKIPVYPGSFSFIVNDAKDALNNAKNNCTNGTEQMNFNSIRARNRCMSYHMIALQRGISIVFV